MSKYIKGIIKLSNEMSKYIKGIIKLSGIQQILCMCYFYLSVLSYLSI